MRLGSFLVFCLLACHGACLGGDAQGGGPDACAGGVVVDGVCEGKCTPDACLPGNGCVGNRCVLLCDSHRDCLPNGTQSCAPAIEDDTGAAVFACQASERAPGIGQHCPLGDECPGPYACLSGGEGDADAYCTLHDCGSDDDCFPGYYCGVTRDPHAICDSNPPKGDNSLCGSTDEPCVDLAALVEGDSRFEGSSCILRRTCLKRSQCRPCTTDLDCSWMAHQRCSPVSGASRCLRECATDDDCDPDYRCDAGGVCFPRFGDCVGEGGFCEPCLDDEDCGGVGTTMACVAVDGAASFACIDLAAPTCAADSDCPVAPSGQPGHCDLSSHCWFPYDAVTNRWSCW
ncbi:MAG: hypothetical protein IT373_18815 [Polyangiaceae bacterium]|nr:hypothetical protein [Polyangiaceae bacterium]